MSLLVLCIYAEVGITMVVLAIYVVTSVSSSVVVLFSGRVGVVDRGSNEVVLDVVDELRC